MAPEETAALVDQLASRDLKARRKAAFRLGEARDSAAVGPLISALSEDVVRREATDALTKIGSAAVVDLCSALSAPVGAVRRAALDALGRIRDDRALDPLVALLESPDGEDRKAAAAALGRLRNPRACDSLIRSLSDEDVGVRRAAASALGRLGEPRAVEPLALLLEGEEYLVEVVEAIGRLGPEGSVDRLVHLLKADPREHVQVWKALERAGSAAVEALVELLHARQPNLRAGAATTLGAIGGERAIEALLGVLEDEDTPLVVSALQALGQPGDSRTVSALARAARSPDPLVRLQAIEALGKVGDPAAVRPLIDALSYSEFGEVAVRALEALLEGHVAQIPPEELRRLAATSSIVVTKSDFSHYDDQYGAVFDSRRSTISTVRLAELAMRELARRSQS